MSGRKSIEERLAARLAPGERVIARTRLHWGLFAGMLFSLSGILMWGTPAAAFMFVAAALHWTVACTSRGTSVMALTGKRFILVSESVDGRASDITFSWM